VEKKIEIVTVGKVKMERRKKMGQEWGELHALVRGSWHDCPKGEDTLTKHKIMERRK
jgi:hypothetical protein